MTSTPQMQPLDGCDDPASVLGRARDARRAAAAQEREVAKAAAKWLAMHATGGLVGPADAWHERSLPLGGEGTPEVAEFCVPEFAAALGLSPDAGRALLAKYAEGFYRLTRCWTRLDKGQLDAWRIRMIAERTMSLSPAAAAFVDTHVAPVAHKIGPAQLLRLVAEAAARFDPSATEAARAAAAETRHVDIDLAGVGVDGIVFVDAALDLADALDLETAVADRAHQLLLAGCSESLDVRRSMALGLLARGQHGLDFEAREVVIHAHIAAEALTGDEGDTDALARVEQTSTPVTVEQVRTWCGNPYARVTVKPVLDLGEHVWVGAYEASTRLREQTNQRDGTCIHPWCTRPATGCDLDHRVPHADDGPTCSCNLAPLCRRHHRAKTTGGWTYVTVEPGTYLWRSPLGYQYLRDHTGTLDVTPDHDRLRYAHKLLAHFGDPGEP